MKYQITNFDESMGQIIVDFGNNMRFAIDLPVDDLNKYPEGKELESLILSHYPTWHVERIEKLSSGITNVQYIKDLLPKEATNNTATIDESSDTQPAIPNAPSVSVEESEQLQKEAFEEIVIDILKARGIIDA